MSKEIDRYLKAMIEGVPAKLKEFEDGVSNKMVYYTGNWSQDIAANLTERQAEKLQKKMDKFRDRKGLAFFQKKLEPLQIKESEYTEAETIYGYQYVVMKVKEISSYVGKNAV